MKKLKCPLCKSSGLIDGVECHHCYGHGYYWLDAYYLRGGVIKEELNVVIVEED